MTKHLLYVAWGFPPCRGSGVYRALATPNLFAQAGWRVTVLTASVESFEKYTGADHSLLELVRPNIRVVRLPFERSYLNGELATWSRFRIEAPDLWLRWRRAADVAPFPEANYGFWRRPLERAARAVHREDPVDLVIATANPHVDFVAAAELAKVGVPYVMDYRDAWQLDVFSGARVTAPRSRVARWESRLIAGAKEVWFVNEPIRTWHAELYPEHVDRMHVVPNGFDGGLGPRGVPSPTNNATFGFLGTISAKVPMAELVDGWKAFCELRDRDGCRALLAGYVGFGGESSGFGTVSEPDAQMEYIGPVPKGDVADFYARCNALLLVLGTGRYVTSGKVFEYLATGLPIVSVHDPRNAVNDVLRGYPLWFPAEGLEPAQIASALERAAREVQNPDPERWHAAATWGPRVARSAQLAPRIADLASGVSARD